MRNRNTNIQTRAERSDRRRIVLSVITVFTLLLALLMQAPARAADGENTQDLIRAAMVYNFCKFVDWPQEKQDHRLVLGVMGGDFKAPDFSSIDGKAVQDKALEVRAVESRQELAECNLVYISQGQNVPLPDAFAESQEESILTISEIDDFCVQGGIIQMVPRRGKMRFFINRQAADEAGLVLSSQLLKMARIVEGD